MRETFCFYLLPWLRSGQSGEKGSHYTHLQIITHVIWVLWWSPDDKAGNRHFWRRHDVFSNWTGADMMGNNALVHGWNWDQLFLKVQDGVDVHTPAVCNLAQLFQIWIKRTKVLHLFSCRNMFWLTYCIISQAHTTISNKFSRRHVHLPGFGKLKILNRAKH
jgi:hypothetical protein